MVEDGEVRPEGCICEPCSDIPRYMKLPIAKLKAEVII